MLFVYSRELDNRREAKPKKAEQG